MGDLHRRKQAERRQAGGSWRDEPPYPSKLELLRKLRMEQDDECDEADLMRLNAGQVHDEIQRRLPNG